MALERSKGQDGPSHWGHWGVYLYIYIFAQQNGEINYNYDFTYLTFLCLEISLYLNRLGW